MVSINAREVACQGLLSVLEQGEASHHVMKRVLRQNGAMPQVDKDLVTELMQGVLRNINWLDYVLERISKRNPEQWRPWIRTVLRVGAYQLLLMDRIPDFAICNESVQLVKKHHFQQLVSFVNGVLRNLARGKDQISLPDPDKEPLQYLSVRYSHPGWLLKMWMHEYSFSFVEELCQANQIPPKITICCNQQKITPKELFLRLQKRGVWIEPGNYFPGAFLISNTGKIANMPEFQEGLFHVQDESSMLAAALWGPQKGERVLDLCAAPGGKTFFAAERMHNEGEVFACDIYESKVDKIIEGANRLGLTNITAAVRDATEQMEGELYDRVIADVPCSGFGLLRKKPDIRYHKTGEDIDALLILQKKILSQGASLVKPGGIFVYSTCTICKKENQKNIEWFLDQFPFERCDISAELPAGMQTDTKGMVQLFPHIHHTDGFFVAKMKRKDESYGKN